MNKDLYVVLMAGGVGVRFWPYSRNSKPKQFLDVLGTGKIPNHNQGYVVLPCEWKHENAA